MKRFHVHVHVDDLPRNLAFYSALFGTAPTRTEADYAKWMLEDPPLNFAISTRGGGAVGVNHLGIQTDTPEELAAMKARAEGADGALLDEGATTCCYARSDKHWVTDPQGLAWEQFHTLGDIPVFSQQPSPVTSGSACCPAPVAAPKSSCCG
ncbi:MAG: ArsI/CadI family heavy metal resistance metalloenzyme [Inhella sp.]|jgi:predicted enzyme related to lactoylglutathione lyase|uniref:ArsI/CadI family heavy metal resistance metalloenzyme n=1 Tax=Inhella sp. TaxID=1921806 RepID=UPI0022C79612|nr:ArsI/CadI family heavy metal resistance metalloenzyme [Inhella sp.]MCZ8234745.1 ArsI/CadI family heavy metal resistance metalloenzyme [Inhella sp.]